MHINIDRIFTTVARNLGLDDYSRYINSWIEWTYEAEKLIGSIDTFVQREATYDASGAQATGTINFTSNPSSGDSIVLNGTKLYFKNTTDLGAAENPNEIKIGTGLAETFTDGSTAPYGLLENLKGFKETTTSPMTGTILNSAILNYPETLNIANYTINSNFTGDNLITNGDFSTALGAEWDLTLSGGGGSIALSSSQLLFTQGSSSVQMYASQDFTTVSGTSYELSVDSVSAPSNTIYLRIMAGTSQNASDLGIIPYGGINIGGANKLIFTATGTTTWITVNDAQGATGTSTWDNVVVKEIDTMDLTITAKEIGPKGNEYTLDSDSSNSKISGLNLTGGKGIYRNQQITLPEDNIKLLAVRVGTDDSDHEHTEIRKSSAIHRGRIGKNTDDSKQRAFRYYVDGNRLNIQHDDIDEITIVYLAYPKDMRGYPMVKEGHETAVAQYIMWQTKLIEFYNGKLPQYITKELEKDGISYVEKQEEMTECQLQNN